MNGDESINGPNVVPLRTILRKFLNLVENYEARRNGGLDSYDSEFQDLKQFSENLKADPDHVCREGEKNVNRKKNRYKDILPYDFSRVILSDYGDVPGSDYINANFIKGASGSSAYIACQGPLPHTVNEFWRMVVECEVQVIVMACNEQESGKHKCENYWVEEDGVEREYGQVTVWLKKCRNVCPDFLVRTMRIRFTNSRGESEERNVCQFHYSAWPDHGVPTKVRPLLDMVRLIRDCQTSETLPVLVHCSAGCGRTGTICAIDYVWGLLRLGRLTPDFSLFNLVRDMRSQRIAMVQTKDQYILVHRAVKELFQEQLKIIDAHPYANVDENGLPLEIKRELQEPTYETLECKSPKSPLAFMLDKDSKGSSYVDNNNIVVSVSNVNTQSNYHSNNFNNSALPLPLPLPPKTTDAPSSSPLSSTGSGSAGASGEESRKISLDRSPAGRANIKNSNSSSNGPGMQSSSSSEDRNEKLLKGSAAAQAQSSTSESQSLSNSEGPSTKTSISNPLRSALLRKPSISKLKSFFEKTPKEDKDKEKEAKKSGSIQLSRAKSDVSTRFYAFKDFTSSFTSRTPPPPSPLATKTTSPAADKEATKLGSDIKSENSNTATGNPSHNHKSIGDNANSKISASSKKPAVPSSKPVLSIKRSKSLKVPSKLTTTTINYQNNVGGIGKTGKDILLQNQTPNSVHSSSSGASGSSGFSSTITDSPIKVCVKQVEIPKLQSVVSKSVKPEVLLATSTTTSTPSTKKPSQEYDYDIDDRSHLRQQKPISTSSSSVFQLQQESFQPSHSSSSSPEANSNLTSVSKPIPSSRIHILKDNHSYSNVIYANSKHAADSNVSNNNHRSGGRSRTMEDIQDFPSSNGQNNSGNGSGNGLKFHGKLKKCDTVNPRILASSLGYTHPAHERSSILTRSHSHVWQPDKLSSSSQLSLQQQQQQSVPIRIFSSDNIHQPSSTSGSTSASTAPTFKVNNSDRNSTGSSKNITMGTGSGIEYPVIMRKPKHSSSSMKTHRKPMRESNDEPLENSTFVHSVSVSASPSPITTYQNTDRDREKGYHSRESSLEKTINSSSLPNSNGNGKPVVRRRVPKTNPYANYPTCVTGSNSNFPYKLLNSNSNTIGTGNGSEDIFSASGSNSYSSNNNVSNSFGNYGNTSNDIVNANMNTNPIAGHQRKDSNSSIPILKPSYGGSVGNSSESSSNTETPRNSLPSTPTQSVDVLFPQLHRNNNSSSLSSQNLVRQQTVPNNNYGSISSGSSYSQSSYKTPNPKSILKDQLMQQQLLQPQQSSASTTSSAPTSAPVDETEKIESLRNFQVTQSSTLASANNNTNVNSSSSIVNNSSTNPSHIPKINTVRIAVGVRERRNSFRQAVWKEAPNSNHEDPNPVAIPPIAHTETPRKISSPLGPNQINQMYNNSFSNASRNNPSTSSNTTSSSQVPSLPKIHKNYEPIWLDSSTNHSDHFQSSAATTSTTSTGLNYSPSLQAMPRIHPSKIQTTSNSNTFPYIDHTSTRSKSEDPPGQGQDIKLLQKSLQPPPFQNKVDEIKIMLAELNAPMGGMEGKMPSRTNVAGSNSSGTTSLKQQRSLRAPSRSQYQQGLSCFTFKKPSSYESLVDQLHQEQEQQDQDLDSDEYQPLINNTGTSSSSMGSTTGVGTGTGSSSTRKDFLQHPISMRDEPVSRNISRGAHAHAQANDYVTLRQCRTLNNTTSNSNNSHTQQSLPFQNHSNHGLSAVNSNSRQSSSSSPEFPKKFSMNSSSSASPQDYNSNTPVPPPRSKTKRGGGHGGHSSSKSPPGNYDRDFQTDLSHPSWPVSVAQSSSSYSQPSNSNSKSNHYPIIPPKASAGHCELPRPQHSYDEYDVGQPNRRHLEKASTSTTTSSSDEQVGNANGSSSNPTTTSPKAIIRALGLFQAKAANVRSRLANWTEAKDRSKGSGNGNSTSDSSSKRVHENGNGPTLDQSNGNGTEGESINGDLAGVGGSSAFGSSRIENHQLSTTGPGHIMGRSKHQYL